MVVVVVLVVVVSSLEGPGFLFRVRQTATSVNLANSAVCCPDRSSAASPPIEIEIALPLFPLSPLFLLSYLHLPYRRIKIQLTLDYGFRGAAISLG